MKTTAKKGLISLSRTSIKRTPSQATVDRTLDQTDPSQPTVDDLPRPATPGAAEVSPANKASTLIRRDHCWPLSRPRQP